MTADAALPHSRRHCPGYVVTAAGQDGERLVTETRLGKAATADNRAAAQHGDGLTAALAAVALDLDRAGYERGRRELGLCDLCGAPREALCSNNPVHH